MGYQKVNENICICSPGFLNMSNNSTLDCQDVNECHIEAHCNQPNEHCINLQGTFKCECNYGFKRVDEYMDCQPLMICDNGFEYIPELLRCENINECANKDLNNCGINSICQDEIGIQDWAPNGYSCTCEPGFQLHNSIDSESKKEILYCVDIDECLIPQICFENQICQNYDGNYSCECESGYIKNNLEECIELPKPEIPETQNQEIITPIDGQCEKGYQLNKNTNLCEDIDECFNYNTKKYKFSLFRPCNFGFYCVNQPGTYYCTNDVQDPNINVDDLKNLGNKRRMPMRNYRWQRLSYAGKTNIKSNYFN